MNESQNIRDEIIPAPPQCQISGKNNGNMIFVQVKISFGH
jgi:hypothetical protein